MDLIEINCSNYGIMNVTKTDTYGGKRFDLSFSSDLLNMIEWYKVYQKQLDLEIKARREYESVAAAYEQYQTTLKLVLDQL